MTYQPPQQQPVAYEMPIEQGKGPASNPCRAHHHLRSARLRLISGGQIHQRLLLRTNRLRRR
jgi:hypothetical protein